MNFETNESFERQLSRLLAMIVMFQKKIEQLRKKLAGNEEFHTRLVFQKLDVRKRGQIKPQDLTQVLSHFTSNANISHCQAFCRKYTISGAITYDEMLSLISPKTDKTLSQRLMVRTAKRGATLPDYLWKFTCELLNNMLSLSIITEKIRKSIQNSSQLNHLQMLQFFKKCLTSNEGVWKFCNMNSDQQYDFVSADVRFLSTHIRSGNQINQFTEEDIKQIICPLDMNFQKTVNEMGAYYDNLKQEKQRTMKGFYAAQQPKQAEKTANTNFLGMTYQRSFQAPNRMNQNNINVYNISRQQPIPHRPSARQHLYYNIDPNQSINVRDHGNSGNMYLDNFIKPPTYSSSRGIQLDKFLSSRNPRKGFERFEDNLPDNYSSSDIDQSGSAFVEY